MLKKTCLYFVFLFFASCGSYQMDLMEARRMTRTNPTSLSPDVFYIGQNPVLPYVKQGEYHLRLTDVAPSFIEKHLQAEAFASGFDGVILLDHQAYYKTEEKTGTTGPDVFGLALLLMGADVEVEPSETYSYTETTRLDELSYAGILYVHNICEQEGDYLDSVEIERIREDTAMERAVVFFDWMGQIKDLTGNSVLFEEAKVIQPWFFLDQKGYHWRVKHRNGVPLPNRILQSDFQHLSYKARQNAGSGWYYRFKDLIANRHAELRVHLTGGRPYPTLFQENGHVDTIYNVHLGNAVREQLWVRTGLKETIRYVYHYKHRSDLPPQWVVLPEKR